MPEEYVPEIKDHLQSVGLKWEDFKVTDNSCKPHPPAENPLVAVSLLIYLMVQGRSSLEKAQLPGSLSAGSCNAHHRSRLCSDNDHELKGRCAPPPPPFTAREKGILTIWRFSCALIQVEKFALDEVRLLEAGLENDLKSFGKGFTTLEQVTHSRLLPSHRFLGFAKEMKLV